MEAIGIFTDLKSAASAVDGLIRAGFLESQITSLTSVPYPAGALVRAEPRGWFRWVSLAGAVTGALAGFALAAGTAWLYPVRTGAKPIIALFPTGIVTFEVTMLFALIGTMVGMFLEMRLPALSPRLYDPGIGDGLIGISLTMCGPGEVVVCGAGREGIEHCIGSMSHLPLAEQKLRVAEVMREAGALRTVME